MLRETKEMVAAINTSSQKKAESAAGPRGGEGEGSALWATTSHGQYSGHHSDHYSGWNFSFCRQRNVSQDGW